MILITGATGYLGTALAKKLSKEDIRILTRNNYLRSEYEIIVGDLRNYEDVKKAVKGIDYVYHVGALVDHHAPQELLDSINVGGTDNIIKAAINEGLEKITHISSVAADEKKKFTNYSISKRRSEELVKSYWSKLEIPIIRPSGIYDDEWIRYLSKFSWVPFPKIEMRTHLSYMDPLVDAITNSRKYGKSKVYTVVDRDWIYLKDFYVEIVKASGRKPLFVPKSLYYTGLLGIDALAFFTRAAGLKPIASADQIETVLQDRTYDSKPAARELKFKPADTRAVIKWALSSS